MGFSPDLCVSNTIASHARTHTRLFLVNLLLLAAQTHTQLSHIDVATFVFYLPCALTNIKEKLTI